MMNKFFKYPLVVLLVFYSALTFAQSDYEMVQNFKSRVQSIQQSIKDAASLEELQLISSDIDALKGDFIAKKDLLDKSLYPDNFNSSLEKLVLAVDQRKGDFTQIVELKTEVEVLKSEVDLLNKRNTELINQIQQLEFQQQKDAKTIARLEKLVSDLRVNIRKRDDLIIGIIDSLSPKLSGDMAALSQQEKGQIVSQLEKENVIGNIKKSLRDNNRFLEVTSLRPQDLQEVQEQQKEFVTMWQKVGPKLVDVYANKKDKVQDLKDIDNLFEVWKQSIRREAWESINEEFTLNGITLQSFRTGEEFTDVVISFINDEIKNYGVKSKEESENTFIMFADSTWFKSITNQWMPYLLENNLLTTAQKDQIEKNIAEWKSAVFPKEMNWLYFIIIGVVVLALIVFFVVRKKGGKSVADTPPPGKN